MCKHRCGTLISSLPVESTWSNGGIGTAARPKLLVPSKCSRQRMSRVNLHLVIGDPATAIVKLARRLNCDLIVMGTRGMGKVAGLVLGSVATKVVHLADAPVTLVK